MVNVDKTALSQSAELPVLYRKVRMLKPGKSCMTYQDLIYEQPQASAIHRRHLCQPYILEHQMKP